MHLAAFDDVRRSVRTGSGEISYLDSGAGAGAGAGAGPGAAGQPAAGAGGAGPGRVALFVHGVGTNAYLWRKAVDRLRHERRCIALDLPLHGRSPARPDQDFSLPGLAAVVEELCVALSLSTVDLVAHDTGGAVAQVFAAEHPERLATLTLTNCDTQGNLPPPAFKPAVEQARAGLLAPGGLQLMADPELARRSVFGSGYQDPSVLSDELVRAFLEPVFGTLERGRQFERLLCSLDDRDLEAIEPRLRALKVPTLLVWGTDDVFFGLEWARWLRDTVPGTTELVEVPGGRLFFPDERPDDLVEPLRRFWSRFGAGRRAA